MPAWLEKHFERLRTADRHACVEAPPPDEAARERQPAAWLDAFCKDMQGVLLAELEIRLQPVEGLLDALRMSQPGRHE